MKALILFGSTTKNTRKAAERLPELLNFQADVLDVKKITDITVLSQYDFLIFMASTWGDGELQIDMENLFVRNQFDLNGKPYTICELGNYYGYDDFEFGASKVMQHYLQAWGGRELVESFSLDSLPKKDWHNFERWTGVINRAVLELG